jgi:hypothetical protein
VKTYNDRKVVKLVRDETFDNVGERIEVVEPGAEERGHDIGRNSNTAEEREDDLLMRGTCKYCGLSESEEEESERKRTRRKGFVMAAL